jgi:hypothetical protein
VGALDECVLLQHPLGAQGGLVVGRQEGQAGRVLPRGGQLERHHLAQERVRDLDHDARAVAGVGLGAARATVVHPPQGQQPLGHDVVGPAAVDIGDEGDPAGVVLKGRVVQALLLRSGVTHRAS